MLKALRPAFHEGRSVWWEVLQENRSRFNCFTVWLADELEFLLSRLPWHCIGASRLRIAAVVAELYILSNALCARAS